MSAVKNMHKVVFFNHNIRLDYVNQPLYDWKARSKPFNIRHLPYIVYPWRKTRFRRQTNLLSHFSRPIAKIVTGHVATNATRNIRSTRLLKAFQSCLAIHVNIAVTFALVAWLGRRAVTNAGVDWNALDWRHRAY